MKISFVALRNVGSSEKFRFVLWRRVWNNHFGQQSVTNVMQSVVFFHSRALRVSVLIGHNSVRGEDVIVVQKSPRLVGSIGVVIFVNRRRLHTPSLLIQSEKWVKSGEVWLTELYSPLTNQRWRRNNESSVGVVNPQIKRIKNVGRERNRPVTATICPGKKK